MSVLKKVAAVAFALAFVAGCAGPVDTSKSYSRSVIQGGGVVAEEELRVAEYLNYYEQNFPEPATGSLGLDVRVGNWQVPAGESEVWVQVGLQARSPRPEDIAPLNLALVIDCSGSMADEDKMPFVKQSLRTFLQSLAANDRVAIVRYADRASIVSASRHVGDGAWIDRAIDQLQPGGSTNLHAGLMLGFDAIARFTGSGYTDAVILLSDGIANVGVVDPAEIAQAARERTKWGTRLSAIGLGHDFNDALLAELAKEGQGAYHFIDSGAEMDKVFRRDVLGLFAKAAENISLTLRPAEGAQILSITGQQQTPPAGPVTVPLRDMGLGDSQVLLVRMRMTEHEVNVERTPLKVELQYVQLRPVEGVRLNETLAGEARVVVSAADPYNPLADVEVLRNVTIQRSAEGLKQIARFYAERRYIEAYELARSLERDLARVAAMTGEAQMVEDANMMRGYADTLIGRLPPGTLRDAGNPVPAPTRFLRGVETPTVIEVR